MRLGGLRGIGAETSPFIPASCFPITSEHILTCEQLPHRSSRFCQSQTGISVRIFSSYSSSARAVVSISLHDFAVCVLISVCSGYPYHLTSTQAAALLKRGFRVSELACDVQRSPAIAFKGITPQQPSSWQKQSNALVEGKGTQVSLQNASPTQLCHGTPNAYSSCMQCTPKKALLSLQPAPVA